MNNYNDIINLPHKQSDKRPHMTISNRAAQFAPFAALTGYDSAIAETGRRTDERRELTEEVRQELNGKLQYIAEHLARKVPITITYFQPDTRKTGGTYRDYTGIVRYVDSYEGVIAFETGEQIFIDDISDISGSVFETFE